MKTYMLWHGGASYAVGEYKDIEEFDSLSEAKYAFTNRVYDPYYPVVTEEEPEDGGPEAWLWLKEKPADDGNLYPDRILRFGPRGGLVMEEA